MELNLSKKWSEQHIEAEGDQAIGAGGNSIKWGPIPDYGDLFTMEHWLECVKCTGFIDYDGFGDLSDGKMVSNIEVKPSDVTKRNMKFPEWATHVVWYNR